MAARPCGFESHPSHFKMERKCVYDPVVKRSNGRATCYDNFKKDYLDQGKCGGCPKLRDIRTMKPPMSKEDRDAWAVRRRMGYS